MIPYLTNILQQNVSSFTLLWALTLKRWRHCASIERRKIRASSGLDQWSPKQKGMFNSRPKVIFLSLLGTGAMVKPEYISLSQVL